MSTAHLVASWQAQRRWSVRMGSVTSRSLRTTWSSDSIQDGWPPSIRIIRLAWEGRQGGKGWGGEGGADEGRMRGAPCSPGPVP